MISHVPFVFSGKKSTYYFDGKKLTLSPEGAYRIGKAMFDELMEIGKVNLDLSQRDQLFDQAVCIILESQRGSVSLLQRRLNVGYSRASRLIDQMAAAGIVGNYKGSQAREVLMTLEEYKKLKRQMETEVDQGYID